MIFRMSYLVQHVEDLLLSLVGHHDPVHLDGFDVKPRLKAGEEEEEKEDNGESWCSVQEY